MNDIMIIGGGSAGWMTAATLIKFFPNKNISLIESPNISTVGVGESTLGQIRQWTNSLGIDEKDFISHTDASYKLSIKFTDFYKKGSSFHYPFGNPNYDNNIDKLNDWWYKKSIISNTSESDYADCMFPQMSLVNQNKISFENNNLKPFNFCEDTAFHFDATKFGLWLRDHFCLPRGVKHIKEDIKDIKTNEGGIESLNNYKADLYIDCTGFKSLLLSKTLKEEFISYNDLLPNNSAWATKIDYDDKEKELKPYTNCTAINNGWVWNIPLWSRIGTGYVYSDKFISDKEALKEFKKYLGKDNLEFKNIKMRVGIHKRLWVKNVAAIGLSAGFIEPLESNGLFSVHEFLHHLVRALQRDEINQFDKDNFNYSCRYMFHNFAEFVALHYALSTRKDTEYWKSNSKKVWKKQSNFPSHITESIINKNFNMKFNDNHGIHCIAAGMNWAPIDLPSIMKFKHESNIDVLKTKYKSVINNLEVKKSRWYKSVKNEKSLYQFLKDNYYE